MANNFIKSIICEEDFLTSWAKNGYLISLDFICPICNKKVNVLHYSLKGLCCWDCITPENRMLNYVEFLDVEKAFIKFKKHKLYRKIPLDCNNISFSYRS